MLECWVSLTRIRSLEEGFELGASILGISRRSLIQRFIETDGISGIQSIQLYSQDRMTRFNKRKTYGIGLGLPQVKRKSRRL
jgi:hypothetical protein